MVTNDDLFIVLETLYFSGTIQGRKRLQKTICLLKHKYNIPLGFDYTPYFYGPYSEELASSIQSLVGAGYVNEDVEEIRTGMHLYTYSLTEMGRKAIEPKIKNQQSICGITPENLNLVINRINMMEINDLVRVSKTLDLNEPKISA